MKVTTYNTLLERFIEELNKEGEMYFSYGNPKEEVENIRAILNRQGYWSGVYNRYHFSDELFLVNVTPRVFGGAGV